LVIKGEWDTGTFSENRGYLGIRAPAIVWLKDVESFLKMIATYANLSLHFQTQIKRMSFSPINEEKIKTPLMKYYFFRIN